MKEFFQSIEGTTLSFILFFLITFTNVLLQNLKTILVIKATPIMVSFVGLICSLFYTLVMVMVVFNNPLTSIIIVPLGHFCGIFAAMNISKYFEKKGIIKKNESFEHL